jgi:pyruvate,water dikinase
MNRCFIPFDELKEHNIDTIGGKAINLAKMLQAGLPVPHGYIVPVRAYETFFEQNDLYGTISSYLENTDFSIEESITACEQAIKQAIYDAPIGAGLEREVSQALPQGDSTLWAVRSSAVAEDLPEASFAGQQDSYLNIMAADVLGHIKRCWASYWNERAIAYRHHAGMPQLESGIAVVVQKMVDSRTSGVMFTRDPVNGGTDTIVIEASWGLGESIVSGIVSPDLFSCDRETGSTITQTISKKNKGIFLAEGRNMVVDLPPEQQVQPALTRDELRVLVALGTKIESFFGTPQDIEWAFEGTVPYILQSRPITTLSEESEVLWTRAYGDEYWADVTSPLFFSLLGEYLTKYVNHEGSAIMGYHEITDKQLLRLHKGHIYFNSEVLEEVFTFNPKFSRTKELLNYFPEKDQDRIANAKTKTARRLWAEIRIMALDPDGSILRTDAAYKRWAREFLEYAKDFDAADLPSYSSKELYDTFRDMERHYLKHYRLIRYGMVTHSIGTNLMVKRWLVDWLGDKSGELYSKLISGLADNKTIRTNIAIGHVAEAFKNDEELCALLSRGDDGAVMAALASPDHERAGTEFFSLMDSYGHRSHTREIFYPRWRDDPSLVLDVLRALVTSPSIDYEAMEARTRRERLETEQLIFKRIAALPGGFLKKPLFKVVLSFAQTYLIFRENQRFYLDHILARWRRLFSEYGRRFAENGIIDSREDIFFLSKEEIFDLAKSPRSMRHTVSLRRAEFDAYKSVLPPKFLKGKVEFDDTVIRQDHVLKITGTSASPGIASGTVRVIDSIKHLSEVQEHEILVTSNTDPGWTPVFVKLAGLITETGGILSHGAVVSREYGIPAVTAVKGARELFRTGQHVTIDGNEGIIYITEES